MKKKREQGSRRPSTRAIGSRAERRALWHYRFRGYRVLATNVWVAGYELDLVVRRGRKLVFCEVKAKSSRELGDPAEMVNSEKQRRIRLAAEAWLATEREAEGCEARFDVATERAGRLTVVCDAF